MVGHWEYAKPARSTSEPSLNAGLFVGVDIDSVTDASFYGHVSFWFAGDVGVPVDVFGPVSGTVAGDARVALLITMTNPQVPPIRVNGVLSGDRLVVEDSWRGNEPGPFPVTSTFVRTAFYARPVPIRAPFPVRDEPDHGHPATSCLCTTVRDGAKWRLVRLALLGCDLKSARDVAKRIAAGASDASPCQLE